MALYNDYKPESITYANGLETNIYTIAKQICEEPPKLPCSIQLIMDHDVESDIEFDLLADFTMACMQKLFGPNATPMDLSETDFDRLNGYVKSVGYQLSIKKEENETSYRFSISFERYHSAKPNPFEHLKDYMKGN